jgi:hypothetical protein
MRLLFEGRRDAETKGARFISVVDDKWKPMGEEVIVIVPKK